MYGTCIIFINKMINTKGPVYRDIKLFKLIDNLLKKSQIKCSHQKLPNIDRDCYSGAVNQ